MFKNKQRIILSGGLLLGLAARILLLFYHGVAPLSDIPCYFAWGNKILEFGLAQGFRGTYFPIIWQIFGFSSWLVKITGIDYYVIFRAVNLLFDAGSVILLIAILRKMKCNPLFALIYWLHPWFLTIFSSGYVDCQPIFFVLMAVYLLLDSRTVRRYLWAGLPLAVAFLMKPQIEILVVAAFVYALAGYWHKREIQRFALLVFPSVFFLGYNFYFYFNRLYPSLSLKSVFTLVDVYAHVLGLSPVLTANMPNIWYPVAYFVRAPGALIYVNSEKYLMPFVQYRFLAVFLALSLVFWYVFRLSKKNINQPENGSSFLLIFTFSLTVLPFVVTSAHENHFFYASALLIILLAKFGGRLFNFAVHSLLILLFVNLYLLYDLSSFAAVIKQNYNLEIRTVLSVVCVFLFLLIIKSLLSFSFNGADKAVSAQIAERKAPQE
jgi:hypothetical protein